LRAQSCMCTNAISVASPICAREVGADGFAKRVRCMAVQDWGGQAAIAACEC
jgi:hypothetical protein